MYIYALFIQLKMKYRIKELHHNVLIELFDKVNHRQYGFI